MPPSATEAVDETYSITKIQTVIDTIWGIPPSSREDVIRAIDRLQFEPRPDGHLVTRFGAYSIVTFVVKSTQPPYLLTYQVDEEKKKIFVVAVGAKTFN